MPQRAKPHKPNKSVFTIVTDRLRQDSSEELYGEQFLPQNDFNLLGFEFPLNLELQEIHESPQATELSAYIMHLENQVKSITNKIEYEYHQARETVLFLGQSTSMSKYVTRKKIDQEFTKMGIMRKYSPNLKQLAANDIDEDTLAKQPGDLAIDQVKRKIQIEWESQISDEMQKQRRRMRQAQKKRQKQLEQIDKDFEKIMKKRKTQRQLQAQLKSQESAKSLHQNGQDSSSRTPKKIQKRQKMERKSQRGGNNNKRSSKGSVQRNSVRESEIQSCSVMNNNHQEDQVNSEQQVNNAGDQ